jgi:hypothetical protein
MVTIGIKKFKDTINQQLNVSIDSFPEESAFTRYILPLNFNNTCGREKSNKKSIVHPREVK